MSLRREREGEKLATTPLHNSPLHGQHLVVGEGMSSPWLYGFITLVFAFALGLVPKRARAARYWIHVMIEYLWVSWEARERKRNALL